MARVDGQHDPANSSRMKKTGITPLGFVALCAFCVLVLSSIGCAHRLPNIKAGEIHTRTAVMGVVSTADATGINVTESYIQAKEAKWGVSFPGFDHTTVTTDYKQRRDKGDER